MKNRILIALCIFSGVLFLISGLSKLFPVELFELTLVNTGFVNWSYSGILARAIITVELFLGLSLLQKNHIRLIIAGAMVLLAVFSLHLGYTLYTTGNTGNCGCFGELIPMSPLSALIKNIVLLVLLDYLFIEYKDEAKGKLYIPAAILVLCLAALFILFPIQTIQKDISPVKEVPGNNTHPDTTSIVAPLVNTTIPEMPVGSKEGIREIKESKPELMKKAVSPFGEFHNFSDSVYVNLDSGIKIAALLSLDCEHCMAAAKEIVALKRIMRLPPVYFLYLGEKEQLQEFYKNSGAQKIPYKIINARTFFSMLKDSPPRIVFLNNGNITEDWNSTTFSAQTLKEKL